MMFAAWQYGVITDQREAIPAKGKDIHVADGDSFALGRTKLRLDGIDAPEYGQICNDENGKNWPCGKAARGSLEQLLSTPGLACVAEASDQYARRIATCSASGTDIAAAQVNAGMAVSQEYMGMRSYGDEEDAARAAKRGIWRGTFVLPSEWRSNHPTLRTNTLPTE